MSKATKPEVTKSALSINQLLLLAGIVFVLYFGYERYASHESEQAETSLLISTPQVGDIYFIDFRLFDDSANRENKNKYKLAKVVRITDDHLAVVYGRFFYQWQYAVTNSVQHGDLSNTDYFTLIPDYIPLSKVAKMREIDAIYLVKRPKQNKLYGNFVNAQ